MSRMKSFLGLPDASEKVIHLAKIMGILGPVANVTFMISSTFYVIFVAEALGGGPGMYLQGMGLVGVLVVVQMATQTIFDYPTGAIGDWIGQRWVISSASLFYALSFLMVSFVTTSTPFLYLVLIYVLQGFAQSQQSGAWGAWFDNNYRVAMPGDSDRKQYGVFIGRMGMIMQVVATAALIPGGILATLVSRAWVFQLQAILAAVCGVIAFTLVRDFPEVEEERRARNGGAKPKMSDYTRILKDGVSFLVSEPFVRYIIVGSMLVASSIMVWGNLILFPMYFLYLITDVAVASFRTLLFVPGIFAQERSGVWSRRFEPKKWIPRFRLIQTCGLVFFWVFAAIMFLLPPSTDPTNVIVLTWPLTDMELLRLPVENLLPVTIIFLTFAATSFFGGFAEVLTQRVLLDVIPNRIRNSMYSLSPTISMLFAMPQIAVFGWLINIIGFPLTLMSCGVISLIGVILVAHGLKQPVPENDEETWSSQEAPLVVESTPVEEVDMSDNTIDEETLSDDAEVLAPIEKPLADE
ncbi:MAG: MFS transporter [Candidatus Thorarchaeota archaeon]